MRSFLVRQQRTSQKFKCSHKLLSTSSKLQTQSQARRKRSHRSKEQRTTSSTSNSNNNHNPKLVKLIKKSNSSKMKNLPPKRINLKQQSLKRRRSLSLTLLCLNHYWQPIKRKKYKHWRNKKLKKMNRISKRKKNNQLCKKL